MYISKERSLYDSIYQKMGNSLAIRIPKDVVQTLSIENNTLVELNVDHNMITIRLKRKTSLQSLVSGINADNLHAETDTDKALSNEEW